MKNTNYNKKVAGDTSIYSIFSVHRCLEIKQYYIYMINKIVKN